VIYYLNSEWRLGETILHKERQLIPVISEKYRALVGRMDERMRRQWAAAEASQLGRGGIAVVSAATGLARNTIRAGQRELAQPPQG
jgi:hypothetical protein